MDWKTRIQAAFDGSVSPDDDVVEELAQHARAMYAAACADGCAHDVAVAQVDGQIARWRDEAPTLHRRVRREPAVIAPPAHAPSRLAGLAHDIRYAARLLRRQPRFALLASLTMALGISAATTLFSVTYGVLVKPLPWPGGARLVRLTETRGGNPPRFMSFTNAAYLAWRDEASTIDAIAAWAPRSATIGGGGDPERIRLTAATASLFTVLGVRPLAGAFFGPQEETTPVVVLSEALWRQRFGGDPRVLGTSVSLDGRPHTVVGVLPDAQAFPDRQPRAIVPLSVPTAAGNRLAMFHAIARLKPGATAEQAAAEGTGRSRFAPDTGMTTMAIFGRGGAIAIGAEPFHAAVTAEVRRPLLVLLAAVGLLLLTATANVASLQLARATTRRREIAIRAALGAGGVRVTRQLLVESVLLGVLGGTAGVLLAWLLHRAMPALLPADFPRIADLGMNAPVVAFAAAASLMTAVLFGLLPALRLRRVNLVESLAEDGAASVGAGRHSRTAQARLAIMAGQVAIACVLLVGASLVGRSFLALLHADRGFDPSDVMTARLSMPESLYPAERRLAIAGQILDRIATHPGVVHAGFTSEIPLTPGGSTAAFTMPSPIEGGAPVQAQASPRIVSPQFFAAAGMRLVAGRTFSRSDTETTEPAVVVNQTFARKYLGDAPLGRKVPLAGYSPVDATVQTTVIGVVDDVRYIAAGTTSMPELYYPHRQMRGELPVTTLTLLVRSDGETAPLATAIRTAVREADTSLVAEGIATMDERLLTTLARPRLYAVLLGGFALFALAIAGVGLFGVLAYGVAQRSREFAVRTALGATRGDIVRLVARQGLAVTSIGLVVGLLASMWFMRGLATGLYGITTGDPLTYSVVPLALIVVAAAACIVPARRAATLDPLRVLRGSE